MRRRNAPGDGRGAVAAGAACTDQSDRHDIRTCRTLLALFRIALC
jgi:hypothetical protein